MSNGNDGPARPGALERDEQRRAPRIAHTERLGNLGWGEWDLRTGHATHSDQLYAILGRDPADGPVSIAELTALVVPDDRPAVEAALDTLVREGQPLDLRSPDDGLAEVIDIVTSALAAAPGGPLAEILARLRQANPDDDTCILAARPTR